MKRITITGASDDLIEIGGDIQPDLTAIALKYVNDNWCSIWRRINAGGLVQHQVELAKVLEDFCASQREDVELIEAQRNAPASSEYRRGLERAAEIADACCAANMDAEEIPHAIRAEAGKEQP